MLKILIVMMAALATQCFSAQRFFLTDNDTLETTSSIEFTNGAQIALGSKMYTLKMSDDKATETEAFMRKVIIPSIEFRQAAIPDVVNFLLESSRGGLAEPRLNMVLHEQPPPPSLPTNQTISLTLSRVSLYDALTIICEKIDMQFHIDENGFVRITPQAGNEH